MKTRHRLLLWIMFGLGASAVACATTTTTTTTKPATQPASGAVVGAPLGLVSGKPGKNRFEAREAGETSPLPRPYPGAPPAIPHAVTGQKISRAENACLDCHLGGEEVSEGHKATKLSASHFGGSGRDEAAVSGQRYSCLQCHLPLTSGAVPSVVRPRP